MTLAVAMFACLTSTTGPKAIAVGVVSGSGALVETIVIVNGQ